MCSSFKYTLHLHNQAGSHAARKTNRLIVELWLKAQSETVIVYCYKAKASVTTYTLRYEQNI